MRGVVLVVQALLFADGGLTALGLNVANMALVGAFGGYLPSRTPFADSPAYAPRGPLLVSGHRRRTRRAWSRSFAFTVEYAIGGAGGAGLTTVAGR